MDLALQEIGIHAQHYCETSLPGRFQLICDKQWLLTLEKQRKIATFGVCAKLDRRAHPIGELEHPWTRVLVQCYRKQPQLRVLPTQRLLIDQQCKEHVMAENDAMPLSYSQAIATLTSANFKQLWEAAFQRYKSAHVKQLKQNGAAMKVHNISPNNSSCFLPYDHVLREQIQSVFHCPIIHCQLDRVRESSSSGSNGSESQAAASADCHANILPALMAIETSAYICVFFYPPAILTSLYDCITYSPSVLSKCYNKPLFLIYQILQLAKAFQNAGLLLGDLRLHDILLRDNLWLQVIPRLDGNLLLHSVEAENAAALNTPSEAAALLVDNENTTELLAVAAEAEEELDFISSPKFDLRFAYDLSQFSLREYCEMWCNGQLSNFDYLTILNNAVGRSLHNPAYHHIMPWVTDFVARNGNNWRDLSKSKYRLNKGDVHLDLMYTANAAQHKWHLVASDLQFVAQVNNGQLPVQEVPHHVSDFLSEITYFVYMARRTPQHILCEHVRPIWVPAEYPVSIQRLQEWTPDECIPQFYSDPMIFKSIHEDLADLELPVWASCPEDFICKHREALESQYVSERLQHWIDLNFGYKLTGKAAVKSKNVCLSMVDQHKNLCQRGVVQLFTQPHPPKRFASTWFGKTAPRLSQFQQKQQQQHKSSRSKSTSSSANLSKSTENLNALSESYASNRRTQRVRNETLMSSSFYDSANFIELPKDYNPVALLQSLETMQTFLLRTFPKQKPTEDAMQKMINSDLLFEENSEEHCYTNQLYNNIDSANMVSSGKSKTKNMLLPTVNRLRKSLLAQMLQEKQQKELQSLGCLMVELFTMQRIRPLLINGESAQFEQRLKACQTVAELHQQEIPKPLRYVVRLLLFPTQQVVSDKGLPTITPTQLLEPIFANALIPFPINYYALYMLLRSLHAFDHNRVLLDLYAHFNCNGKNCEQYAELDRKRVLFQRKISDCQVLSCCAQIKRLLDTAAFEQFSCVELLLPHVIELLTNEQTCILSAWQLFDPIAQALGQMGTQKYLLLPLLKLYNVESFERRLTSGVRRHSADNAGPVRFAVSSSFRSRKSVKLYHHSFLLRLIVRFGLHCFLQNFIAPLIEAVGGYKEPEDCSGLHYHGIENEHSRRMSRVLSITTATDEENTLTLSRQMEDNEEDSAETSVSHAKREIEDVFSFDEENNSDRISNSGTAENKSLDSFDTRLTTAEEAIEDDAVSCRIKTTPEKQAISDIIYGSKISISSTDDMADKILLKSQSNTDSPNQAYTHGPTSPTIAIPSSTFHLSYQLASIDCDVGASRKSVDSFEILTQTKNNETETQLETDRTSDSMQASIISQLSEAKTQENNRISEMSAESLIWLAHRLGPVLSARFLTRNLLKMLSLCYVGQENLLPETVKDDSVSELNYFTVADARVVGDGSAARVLNCLMNITALYGEEVILLQYFPHMSELIAMGSKRITSSLEGAIISSLQLIKYIVPCLKGDTIIEHIKNIILNNMILPILNLLASTRVLMPSGYLGRSVMARKLIDALYVLCVRIGPEMSKEYLTLTALRPFFLIFDKAYGISSNLLEIVNDISVVLTPPNEQQRELDEIRDVFGPALAHATYLAFLRYLGEAIMKLTLQNLELILTLCHEFEDPNFSSMSVTGRLMNSSDVVDCPAGVGQRASEEQQQQQCAANSFGTQIIGNRLELSNEASNSTQKIDHMELLDMVAYKTEIPTNRHLKGNWLAYWTHEISRADKHNMLNLKQIKLQSFVGHTNSVRTIVALDNENSFISASKDKTVKLWSLRSEGDGRKTSNCQFTYVSHKKSLHSLAFLEAMRYVVSCDADIHIWDPFIGRPLGILESSKHNPITVVKCLPSPSALVLAGTAESTVKLIDTRCMQYVCDWRLNLASQSVATVRCLTVAPSGNWLAAGLSSGSIVVLDTRTGQLLNTWRPMECDLLQLTAANDQQLVSSALDHSLAVWHANDGILHYQLKPPAEPAHYLQTIGSELVFATTANRIGIYSDLSSSHATYSVTKLRSETFRGVLTSLAVLPLNHTFLAGNESGNIVLLC